MTKKTKAPQDEPFNLKHDTMEFSTSADGEDNIDAEDNLFEEDEISAEELEAINDTDENEAAALVAEQTDFEADDDNLPEEDWTDDLPDEAEDDEEENIRR